MIKFQKLRLVFLLAAALWMAAGPLDRASAESRLIVQNGGALNAYLKGLENARLQLDGACELLRGTIGKGATRAAITLSLNGERPEIQGLERLGKGERVLARTSLRVVRALARLGLASPRGRFILRIEEDGLYVGNAERGGRLFSDPCAGLGHFLKLIIGASGQAPESLRTAAAGSAGVSALFDQLRSQANILAILSPGAKGRARIESSAGLSSNTDFSGTPGIAVIGVNYRKDRNIEITLSIDPDAKPGDGAVYAYNPENRFTPISRFPVRIIDVPAPPALPRAAPPPLGPGSSVQDVLEFGGDQRVFTVTVERPGRLVIESSGPTDLAAALFGSADQVLSRDDDGGADYNFRIEAPVEPGQYRLDVTHCCGGAGAFGLSVQLEPFQ